MFTLLHDIRLATRFLLRHRLFTAATAGILAIGISLSATLFAVVHGALIEPWPYRGYDRIVTVRGSYPTQGRTAFSLWSVPEIQDLQREGGIFEQVIAGDARDVNLLYAGRPERVRAAVITPNAFTMLAVPALYGRTLTDADAAPGASPAVVVSFQFWQTRLGADPHVVGQTLRVSDRAYAIVGVMPAPFVFWGRDLWMPLRLDAGDSRRDRRYYMQAQLRPGKSLAAAASGLRLFTARLAADHPENPEYAGLGISLNLLVEDVLRELRPTLYVLLAAVALVLAVAIANLANATLAKSLAREGELALRRAIGGSALQLARQLLIESAIVGSAGGLLGAAAAAFLLPQLLSLIPFGYVPAEARVEIDWRVVAGAAFAAIACGLLIGIAPALRAASVDPGTLLKSGDTRTGSRRRHRWRDAFVAAQVALAVVVLGVAAAAWSNLHAAVLRDPGYHAAGVWTARIALPSADAAVHSGTATYARLLRRLRETSGVTDVALTSAFPIGDLPTQLVSAESADVARRMASLDAALLVVSPGFFHLLDIPITEGRAFADGDEPSAPAVAIVSESLARRLWPDGRALGRRVALGAADRSSRATVIGVAADVAPNAGITAGQRAVFLPIAQRPPTSVAVGIKTMDGSRALADLDAAVRDVDDSLPVYDPAMLAQRQLAALGPRLLAVTLLGVFGASVLALSSVGIYAVVSQSVQERGQEFRIRMTFGAEPRQLVIAELCRTGRIVVASAGSGAMIAAVALRLLAATFTGFGGSIAGPLAGSTAILTALAMLATAIPAYHASRFDTRRRA